MRIMLARSNNQSREIITYTALASRVKGNTPRLGTKLVSQSANECSNISPFVLPAVFLHERVVHSDNKDLAGLLELGVVDVAGNVGAGASRAWELGQHWGGFLLSAMFHVWDSHALKAAGTPTMTPLPLISLARLILLPGESSTRTSRLGMASPFCTKAGAVLWKSAA